MTAAFLWGFGLTLGVLVALSLVSFVISFVTSFVAAFKAAWQRAVDDKILPAHMPPQSQSESTVERGH